MGAAVSRLPVREVIDEYEIPEMGSDFSDSEEMDFVLDQKGLNEPWDRDPPAKKKGPCYFLAHFFGFLVILSIIIFTSLLLLVSFAFSAGHLEKVYSILWTFLSFGVCAIFPCIVYFFCYKPSSIRRFLGLVCLSFFIYFFIVQVSLSFVLPPSCIVSNSDGEIFVGASNINLMTERGIQMQHDIKCNYTTNLDLAKGFFGCSLRPDIELYFGGLPTHFHNAKAMTITNKIFIQESLCLPASVLVHEMTHVWQFQQGLWFGTESVPHLVSWLRQQATNRTGMYDYGGFNGLSFAKKEGKKFTDFNFEQQASILEDYYLALFKNNLSKDYTQLLKYFSDFVLGTCVNK